MQKINEALSHVAKLHSVKDQKHVMKKSDDLKYAPEMPIQKEK